ncbi:putative UDP-rhamnose:rhamnosyltransferase 1 [Jatropha curcas]|uniref:putative UDP-rhamnose:rhamnosyltransferase 1 n=1 Tax=Jatropha curcas TaxID=180498 RepID=UPI001894957F|nr:putative UDP-rhamnose:rhamnosyltransferase 1 [Jatropha curcas]
MIDGDDSRFHPEDFTVPPKWIPFPSKVAYRLHEAKRIPHRFEVDKSGIPKHIFRSSVSSVMASSDIIALRSCFELEADFLRLVRELHGKPVFPVGLLPPLTLDGNGDEDDTWLKIRDWLDKQEKGSVVYIAFGSEVDLSQNEFTELALGLELSGLPFFWASRKRNDYSAELPDGFEERVEGRGMFWTSWVPQPRILSHESVGGFLTHCGFSSIIDALYSGRALIMLPITFDHGLIARVFEDKKVGVEITRDEEDGSYTRDSVADSVKLVMVEEEGKLYRENAKQMSKLFANEELHDRYIDQFVELLQTHRVGCTESPVF